MKRVSSINAYKMYKSRLACNKAITYLYSNDMQNLIRKDIGLPKAIDKDVYGKSFNNT